MAKKTGLIVLGSGRNKAVAAFRQECGYCDAGVADSSGGSKCKRDAFFSVLFTSYYF